MDDRELEEVYAMLSSSAWAVIQNDMEEALEMLQITALDACKDQRAIDYRRGQVAQLRQFLGLKDDIGRQLDLISDAELQDI